MVSSFDVTADGSTIVAGLKTPAQKGLATAWDVSTGEKLFSVPFDHGVTDVDWSPDGKHFVTTTGSPKIYDDTGHLVRTLDEQGDLALNSARFSPDGRFIVTARQPLRGGSQDFRQTIWDWERGEVVNTIEPGNAWNAAILAIFDPTGTRVATNGSNGAPRIWDVETGRSLVTMSAHRGPPWDIAFSPDGSRVATADPDGTVRLFDATSGELVLSLPGHERTVTRLAFSPDGTMLASKGEDGTVRIRALDLDDLLGLAREQVTRTLTDEECLQYLHVPTCPTG